MKIKEWDKASHEKKLDYIYMSRNTRWGVFGYMGYVVIWIGIFMAFSLGFLALYYQYSGEFPSANLIWAIQILYAQFGMLFWVFKWFLIALFVWDAFSILAWNRWYDKRHGVKSPLRLLVDWFRKKRGGVRNYAD